MNSNHGLNMPALSNESITHFLRDRKRLPTAVFL